MARIRTIKPEFWTSEQIMELSPNARLTFIGLWNYCDDHGIHPASPKTLKAELFPSDSFSADEVAGFVKELIGQGLVNQYEADGKAFWIVEGWARHQRIDKPTYRHPLPNIPSTGDDLLDDLSDKVPREYANFSPQGPRVATEGSGTNRRVLREELVTPSPGNGMDRIGDDRIGNDRAGRSPKGSRLANDWVLPDEYRQWSMKSLSWSSMQCDQVSERFRDHWISKPGAGAVRLDWLATWRNWCRAEKKPLSSILRTQSAGGFSGVDYGAGGSL